MHCYLPLFQSIHQIQLLHTRIQYLFDRDMFEIIFEKIFVRFSISQTFSISNKSPGPLKVRGKENLL